MNWWTILLAGLLAGATTCAVVQGGLLVGLINRQKAAAQAAAPKPAVAVRASSKARSSSKAGTAVKTRPASKTVEPRRSAVEDLVPVGGFLAGKFLVLTVVGGLLGALGSAFTFDSRVGAYAQLFAGFVMIMMGLSIAGVPGFETFQFTPPASWTRVVRKSTRSQSAFAPFLLGLATVLIPCGVTISMMVLAATSGSALAGAAVMAVFVLGTVPLFTMYGFITQRYVRTDSRRVSMALGAVVVIMGLVTFNSFLVATAAPFSAQKLVAFVSGIEPAAAAAPAPAPALKNGVQVLTIDAQSSGYTPSNIAAKAGVPTKVVFHTDNTRSCIMYTVFPTLDKQVVLPGSGDTEVDLGILEPGEVPISCSMGMYQATIVVS